MNSVREVQIAGESSPKAESARGRLRVLLVPDSIHWITGTLARSFVTHNDWLDGTIISGAVLDIIARDNPDLFESFDVVHFICPYASRSWLARLQGRLPTVTSHHHVSDEWDLQRHNLDGDAIIVGSSEWADDVVKRGGRAEKVVRIPYGVDASSFLPPTVQQKTAIRKSLGIATDAMVVGFFAKRSSNERDRKGTDVFAAAVQKLSRELPRLAVLIIGPGWDALVAKLSSGGVTCVWKPFVRDVDRMPQMFQALDFYWVTARVEGGPVTLLEAMSTGLSCITTPVGLAKDIVESGVNGIVVPFDDVDAFARQTLALAKDADTRVLLGGNARETILREMDSPVTARGVGKAYDVAMAQFAQRTALDSLARRSGSTPTLSRRLLKRIALLEQLAWAEALMLQGQRALAMRIIRERWLKNPFSSLPPRYLLRNLLPVSILKAMVRAKACFLGSGA